MPSDFDANAYLRAFPDIAQAVSDGIWQSPWQHYRQFGYIEGRLTQDSYVRIANDRQPEGQIDSYGHSSVAGGWIFCGWTPEQRDESKLTGVVVHFQDGDLSSGPDNTVYHHSGIDGDREGLVLFVQGARTGLGALIAVDVRRDRSMLTIPAHSNARHMTDQEIIPATRSLLLEDRATDSYRELAILLSTHGYGRLRRTFNTLSGFVDLYGYHGASGGWFFCGWLTRSWDEGAGPQKLVGRFADGDLISAETIVGFWPREDVSGRGIGFVIFMYGSARFLGPLISIELRLDGLPSNIRVPTSSQHFSDSELSARLRPTVERVTAPDIGGALLALLSRKPYAGVDTLAALPDPVFLEFDEVIACPPDGLAVIGWLLTKPGVTRAIRFRSEFMNELVDFKDCVVIERPDVISTVGAEHGFEDSRCGIHRCTCRARFPQRPRPT